MSRVYDPTDPEQVGERQTEAKRRLQQDEADWRWFAYAPQGRRIIAGLLAECGMMQPNLGDSALSMASREGTRAIALRIYARFTQALEAGGQAALLAEVLMPDVRRPARSDDRDAAG